MDSLFVLIVVFQLLEHYNDVHSDKSGTFAATSRSAIRPRASSIPFIAVTTLLLWAAEKRCQKQWRSYRKH